MTDEAATATTTVTTAPATPAAPASPQTPPPGAEPAKSWSVPEAYKDKPWAAKVKSEEDLYKQIDTLDALKGKKTLSLDYATATPEEITAHYAALAPKDVAEYGFDKVEGIDAERMAQVAPILQKAGLTAHQAQAVAKDYAAIEQAQLVAATSEEGFRDGMTKSFGEKYEPVVAAVVAAHKAHMSPEDQAMMEAMPNDWLALNYRLTHKMDAAHKAEIAALKKQYGAEENGDAHLNKGAPVAPVDVEKVRSDLRQKLREIDSRPHTEAEKQKLKDELQATYNQKGK